MKLKTLFILITVIFVSSCNIAFPGSGSEPNTIYHLSIVNADGTGLKHLTDKIRSGGIFTPDDQRIMGYSGLIGYSDGIWSINIDGTNLQVINDSIQMSVGFRIHPDGEKIVYVITDNLDTDLYIADIDGTNIENLTNTLNIVEYEPKFSQDGSLLLNKKKDYTYNDSTLHSICYIDIGGTINLPIISVFTESGAVFNDFEWAGDNKIMYAYWKYGDTHGLYSINIDGTNNTLLFEGDVNGISVCDDGSKIVFIYNSRIWMINSDGTGLIDLGEGQNPIISSDGEKILFNNDARELVIMDVDGSNRVVLANKPDLDGGHHFSWDNEKIVFEDMEILWDK